ncbi:MAG: hypothetical protein R2851_14285 [Caldilineaceae bacterium]
MTALAAGQAAAATAGAARLVAVTVVRAGGGWRTAATMTVTWTCATTTIPRPLHACNSWSPCITSLAVDPANVVPLAGIAAELQAMLQPPATTPGPSTASLTRPRTALRALVGRENLEERMGLPTIDGLALDYLRRRFG